ncbi:MAG: hypothetical protein H6510_03365 [Acidobacteria bacterium]|nr:hypothetical protein [Acidobacteriota bacterium]MCB9396837.1 hypothetical protein [Acidobacteriota bacterium]
MFFFLASIFLSNEFKLEAVWHAGVYFNVDVVGDKAILPALKGGIRFFQLYENDAPILIATLPNANSISEYTAYNGNFGYFIDNKCGLIKVDFSDPLHPQQVGEAPVGNYNSRLAFHNGFVYILGPNELDVINSDDMSILLHTDNVGGNCFEFYDNQMYVGNKTPSGGVLNIYNIENPAVPILQNTINYLGMFKSIDLMKINGSRLFLVIASHGLVALDLQDPPNPQELDTESLHVDFRGSDIRAWGTGVVTSDEFRLHFFSMDGTDLILDQEVDFFGSEGIAVFGDTLICTSYNTISGFSVPMDPANPSWTLEGPYMNSGDKFDSISMTGNLLLASCQRGTAVLDTSENNLDFKGWFSSTNSMHSMHMYNQYLFSLSSFDNLYIHDISNPFLPELLFTSNIHSDLNALTLAYPYIYALNVNGNLEVFDVSDPPNTQMVNTVPGSSGKTILAHGNVLYSLASNLQVWLLDDPINPVMTLEIPLEGSSSTKGMAIEGDLLVASVGNHLSFLNIANPAVPTLISHMQIPLFSNSNFISCGLFMNNRLYWSSENVIVIEYADLQNPVVTEILDASPGIAQLIPYGDSNFFGAGSKVWKFSHKKRLLSSEAWPSWPEINILSFLHLTESIPKIHSTCEFKP